MRIALTVPAKTNTESKPEKKKQNKTKTALQVYITNPLREKKTLQVPFRQNLFISKKKTTLYQVGANLCL